MLPIPTLLLAAFVVCLAVLLLAATRRRGTGFRAADYRPKPLLSRWELRTLAEIGPQLPKGYYACPQVRLADLLSIEGVEPDARRAAVNRVASKSVDFAIIDEAGRVMLVIELDDKSHGRPDRRQRDQLVDAVLKQCRVAVLRIKPGQRVSIGPHLPSRPRSAAG